MTGYGWFCIELIQDYNGDRFGRTAFPLARVVILDHRLTEEFWSTPWMYLAPLYNWLGEIELFVLVNCVFFSLAVCCRCCYAGDAETVRLGRWCAQRSAATVAGDARLWVDSSVVNWWVGRTECIWLVNILQTYGPAARRHCISLDITLRPYRQMDSIQSDSI